MAYSAVDKMLLDLSPLIQNAMSRPVYGNVYSNIRMLAM